MSRFGRCVRPSQDEKVRRPAGGASAVRLRWVQFGRVLNQHNNGGIRPGSGSWSGDRIAWPCPVFRRIRTAPGACCEPARRFGSADSKSGNPRRSCPRHSIVRHQYRRCDLGRHCHGEQGGRDQRSGPGLVRGIRVWRSGGHRRRDQYQRAHASQRSSSMLDRQRSPWSIGHPLRGRLRTSSDGSVHLALITWFCPHCASVGVQCAVGGLRAKEPTDHGAITDSVGSRKRRLLRPRNRLQQTLLRQPLFGCGIG